MDGIYENPLDLIEDLKKARLELKDDESVETPEQVNHFRYLCQVDRNAKSNLFLILI